MRRDPTLIGFTTFTTRKALEEASVRHRKYVVEFVNSLNHPELADSQFRERVVQVTQQYLEKYSALPGREDMLAYIADCTSGVTEG